MSGFLYDRVGAGPCDSADLAGPSRVVLNEVVPYTKAWPRGRWGGYGTDLKSAAEFLSGFNVFVKQKREYFDEYHGS